MQWIQWIIDIWFAIRRKETIWKHFTQDVITEFKQSFLYYGLFPFACLFCSHLVTLLSPDIIHNNLFIEPIHIWEYMVTNFPPMMSKQSEAVPRITKKHKNPPSKNSAQCACLFVCVYIWLDMINVFKCIMYKFAFFQLYFLLCSSCSRNYI